MAHYSGKKLYLEFDGVALSADHRGLDVSRAAKTDDTTAGADEAESHIVLTTSASFDLTLLDDDGSGGDDIRAALIEGAQGLFVFGPQGNEAGKPCYSCQATVTSVSVSYPYDKSVEVKATLTRNGDWVQNYDVDPLTGVFPVTP